MFKSIFAVALTAASLLVAGEAQARPEKIIFYTTETGVDVSVRPLGKASIEVIVEDKYRDHAGFLAVRNCQTGALRYSAAWGYTEQQIYDITTVICR